MCSNTKRSMFLPRQEGDDGDDGDSWYHISLGHTFGSYRKPTYQGFDGSGSYYLFFQCHKRLGSSCVCCDPVQENELRVTAIWFNQSQMALEKNVLKIFTRLDDDDDDDHKDLFDATDGSIIHVAITGANYEDNNDNELIVSIYYFYLFNDLKTSNMVKNQSSDDAAADVILKYPIGKFNKIRCRYGYRVGDVARLVVVASHQYYDDDTREWKFRPIICVDVVHTEKGKIWSSHSMELDLSVWNVKEYIYLPEIELTKERIYFYQEPRQTTDTNFDVHEVALSSGNHIHSYDIAIKVRPIACLQSYHDSVFVTLNVGFGKFHILKLANGFTTVVKEISMYYDYGQDMTGTSYITAFPPIRRLDRTLIPVYDTAEDYQTYMVDADDQGVQSTEMNMGDEFTDYRCRGVPELNWNMKELGVIYILKTDAEHRHDGGTRKLLEENFGIKNIRFNGQDDISLKNLARMALLTSFSEATLKKQNLPATLFKYLGLLE